jgi:hypothetical protein
MTASLGAFLNLPADCATATIGCKTNFVGTAKEEFIWSYVQPDGVMEIR